ncbi:hypothetical protein BU17DRAFT_72320 [Hysterangium stoloniferum]|nr:hypothetical protein BU17DRAFT_72320 [Hysterangium stoloniferum]
MTVQQNDGKRKSWVLDSEHALKKKGVGWGIHVSGVICATKGQWNMGKIMRAIGQVNYFVKQLCEKIIPAFEKAHGPGYEAFIIVNNSQGHSAHSEDALLVSQMDLCPGGKHAHMHNGWFIHNGEKIDQQMMYPPNHPEFPNQLKGMRATLMERGLWTDKLRMQCKGNKLVLCKMDP